MKKIFLPFWCLFISQFSMVSNAQIQTSVPVNNSSETNVVIPEVEKIAQEAFIYGYPMVELYGIMYNYSIDEMGSQYKAPFNKIANEPKVFTPFDTAVVTPNSDTPYSFLNLDLRTEPMVISVPEIEKGRYYSIMFLDLYTYVYDVVGSRTTGNEAGKFLVVGPNWKGETPNGIKKVLRCETDFSMAIFRTQLFNANDLKNVIKIQDQYKVEPLSAYLKKPAPKAAPAIEFLPYDPELTKGPEFYIYLNEILKWCPILPSEKEIRAKFESIGFADKGMFMPESKDYFSIDVGQLNGTQLLTKTIDERMKSGVNSSEYFGSREFLGSNYMNRAIGAKLGIGGLIEQEAMYFPYKLDNENQPINTEFDGYTITFKKDELPPVNAFWSLTMYDGATQLLVENPIYRYLINSPMLPELKYNEDGSLTIYIQKSSPGSEKESNWLPAPKGDAYLVLRCYWPKENILDGKWKAPKIIKNKD